MAKKLRKLGAVSVVLMSCLAAVAAGACVALLSSPASAMSHRIATVTDNSSFACSTATEWHFIMTGLTSPSQAARKIRVRWTNGREADLLLDGVSGGIAHYYSSAHRTSTVAQLSAIVPIGWTGGLKLFTAPVGACTGTYTYVREPDGRTHIKLKVKAGNTEIECEYERQLGQAPQSNVHVQNGDNYDYQEEYAGFGNDVSSCLASTFGAASVGTLRSCLVGVVGASATEGRFGYAFSNTIAVERVTKNILSNGGTPPFASIDTGALVPRWSEPLSLGTATTKWSFAGIDDLGVVKGTAASPLTVNLPARLTVVTTSNKCPYVPPAGCRQGSLSTAADNNILIRGNADVAGLLAGGRLAVQGDITGSTWQAGRDLANVPARVDAAVNGNNKTASGHTPNGSMAIAGTVKGSMHASGSVRTETTPSIPVDIAWATEASQVWGETAATAPVVMIDSSAANKMTRSSMCSPSLAQSWGPSKTCK
jgi:hypothetical protein